MTINTATITEALQKQAVSFTYNDESGAYIPFPDHLLPLPLGQFVREASGAIGCDASFVALPLISALAAAVGDSRRLQVKRNWIVPSIIWTATIGESGTAKSPAFRCVMRYPKQRQEILLKEHEGLARVYEESLDKYESELNTWKKKKLWNGGIQRPQHPLEPPMPRTTVSDATIEGLVSVMANNPAGLLGEFDELAGWFGSHDKYRSKGDSDAATWLSIYNGDSICVDRKGTGHTHIPSAHISITGCIQPGILERCFTSQHRDSGLAARFLLAYPPRIPKSWNENEISQTTDSLLTSVFDHCFSLEPTIDENQNRTPVLIQLSPDSKELWKAFFNQHNQEQLDTNGDIAAAFSKLEEYPLRFALVFHSTEQAIGTSHGHEIGVETIASAIELTNWFKHEAKRIYNLMDETERNKSTTKLVEWIKTQPGHSTTAREVQRSLKRQYPDSVIATAALTSLADQNLGNWVTSAHTNGGRPKRVFQLTTVDAPTQ
ncbi:YfjI family protein [Mariniblastus sp.]|nr:YfjI family protein [Mariniblastus sp.]